MPLIPTEILSERSRSVAARACSSGESAGKNELEIFLKIGSIKGEADVVGFEDQIEVVGISWGVNQSGGRPSQAGKESSRPSVRDLVIYKYVDAATPILWADCCTAKIIPKARLTFRKAGGPDAVDFFKIDLKDVIVSDVQTDNLPGEHRMIEAVSLNFAEFEMEYSPQAQDGSAGATINSGYSIETNRPI